ncbi:cupin domain-containing protein [Kaistia geumhonensis]|uniref:Mannose-6-phosphate isomerase-like protein (Cupin superfamily) n=1 Tax=Kaistia geumhonensis TaxID=410839 RepID=A0ABU0MCE4_9HYPH|nr:cupin domain-containing protein [Kaistia geumhonensis]MCX5481581.1 cupin domain-containing protein [Kaistia geumhonensis]MDQ0518647.1 mannose-6-phosphate isomerase-like protein (cupin superfamily) [Kaistia geumhonensis]
MSSIAHPRQPSPRQYFLNTSISILVSHRDSEDGVAVIDHHAPFGDSPPLHFHRNEDETFVILSGTVRFEVGGKIRVLTASEAIVVPKGVPHSFRVESVDGARFLTATRGPDFEGLVRMAARPADSDALPAPMTVTPEMAEALASLCAANGIDVVGPPLA